MGACVPREVFRPRSDQISSSQTLRPRIFDVLCDQHQLRIAGPHGDPAAEGTRVRGRDDDMPMRDYSLVGPEAEKAIQKGLATGEWYRTDIPRKQMKELMQRSDGPATRDTILWIALFILFGTGGCYF